MVGYMDGLYVSCRDVRAWMIILILADCCVVSLVLLSISVSFLNCIFFHITSGGCIPYRRIFVGFVDWV
jgi:hypothetical protein